MRLLAMLALLLIDLTSSGGGVIAGRHDDMLARLDRVAEVGRFTDRTDNEDPGRATGWGSTMPRPGTGAFDVLSAVEQVSVLSALLQAHPDLQAEAEQLATGLLAQTIATPWPKASLTSCALSI
jgi:hypothetical protein